MRLADMNKLEQDIERDEEARVVLMEHIDFLVTNEPNNEYLPHLMMAYNYFSPESERFQFVEEGE